MSLPIPSVVPYDTEKITGITVITVAAWGSLLSVFYLSMFRLPDHTTFENTHMVGYFMSLLVANLIQAFGSVMNVQWIINVQVESGPYCTAQGVIKHAGNLATAIWTFIIAVHVFNLLYLRVQTSRVIFIVVVCAAWSFVLLIILTGVLAIQNPENGAFYGIAGSWCWITSNYNQARIFLGYFFLFFVAVSCFVLYTAVLLRVRGNLVIDDQKKWRLQIMGRGEGWKLSVLRDPIDNAMLRVVRIMVWFPAAYTLIIFPMGITRLYEFSGSPVPFWATTIAGVIFNLNGFFDVFLLIFLERHFPDTSKLSMTTKRDRLRVSLARAGGILPFTLARSEVQEKVWQQSTLPQIQLTDGASEPPSVRPLLRNSS